jgi:hypothetical protein
MDEPAGNVTIYAVPKRIDTENLDIDSLSIHIAQTFSTDVKRTARWTRSSHHLPYAGNFAVRVKVDCFDSTPTNGNLTTATGSRRLHHRYSTKTARHLFDESATSQHEVLRQFS